MKKLLALLTTLWMVLACVPVAFAAQPKTAMDFIDDALDLERNSSLFQITEEEQDVDVNDPYLTGRILVLPETNLKRSFRKAAEAVLSYKGLFVLQYASESATRDAYRNLKAEYGKDRVILDRVFRVDLPKAQAFSAKASESEEYLSWGIQNMGMDKVKKKLISKAIRTHVTVALLDTGICYLDTPFWSRLEAPIDMITFNPFPYDFNGHGTHGACTIMEATPDNVRIMPIKTISSFGLGTIFNVYLGFLYADFMGADVVNLSLAGEDTLKLQAYENILQQLVQHGATVVCAAGNEKRDVMKSYPSSSEYVITVSALKKNNRVDRSYSNYGSKIDFAVPGTDIIGLSAKYGMPAYMRMSGTSMSAPHLSAAAALVKCVYPQYTQDQVYALFKRYAIDIEAKGKDIYAGWGRVDLSGFAKRI